MKLIAHLFLIAALLTGGLTYAAHAGRLPEPSGPYGIGRAAYDWTDNSRGNSPEPNAKRKRELMVYLWYPTERPTAEQHGAYMPGAKLIDADPELRLRMSEEFGTEEWAQVLSGAIYSHVVENAPPAKSPGQFPVVIFSHGAGGSIFKYTALFEAMVSRGYMVAAIQHPDIAGTVVFPDGRLVPAPRNRFPPGLTPTQILRRIGDQASRWIDIGTADERFVLDQLTRENAGTAKHFALAGRLD
ncbi:MAG: hypothetical protein KGN79_03635, partial [Acidobacteriota bacterium]|nr:hypothetical protein [Acidobacteriota bacterium]